MASVPKLQSYTICLANGHPVKDGDKIEEKDLREEIIAKEKGTSRYAMLLVARKWDF